MLGVFYLKTFYYICNMEIVILTTTICVLFSLFIFGPMFYAHKQVKKKGLPMSKKKVLKRINRTISDMESEGLYFPDHVKDELKKQREELYCNYSNLPSVQSYDKK